MGTPLGDALSQNISSKADEWDFTEGQGSVLRRKEPDVVIDVRDGQAKLLYPFYRALNDGDDITNIGQAAASVDAAANTDDEQSLIEKLSQG